VSLSRHEPEQESWRVEEIDGVVLLRCVPLLRAVGISHAFSTRRADGGNDFDLGPSVEDGETLRLRQCRFLRATGISAERPLPMRQVHGSRVVRARDAGPGEVEADGAVWLPGDPAGLAASVRHADCVPILLADRKGAAVAAVHAGWRGTAAGIAGRAVRMLEDLGVPASGLEAALGPAILSCCYRVGPEAWAQVAEASGEGGGLGRTGQDGELYLDLHQANRRQLGRAGLSPERIHLAPWCTRCRADLFFSHRREGPAAGRMMASIGSGGR
jgi:YfiH family protein